MALGRVRITEQEKHYPSNASFINSRHRVPQTNDKLISSSIYKGSESNIWGLGARLARTFSHEDTTSTESGDDLSDIQCVSASFASEDSEVSDDEKPSPCTAVNDVTSCVYSVVFLLQARAACCGQARVAGCKSVLGYSTELDPEKLSHSSAPSSPSKRSPKSQNNNKKSPKNAAKDRTVGPALELPSKFTLPESTAESWIAKQRSKSSNSNDNAEVIRAARSILNKLTVEKFDSLFCQLVSCGIKTPYHISVLMREVFEKATTQHHFIPMYADLCVKLEQDPCIASAVQGSEQNFRRLLLDQCQDSFEKMLTPCASEDIVDEEMQFRRKQQALGNIKLVGELLVRGMLGSVLFVNCATQLLMSRATCPDALECLAALIMVAGPKFDTKSWSHYSGLESIFHAMSELTRDKAVPARLRYLLRDVLDARSAVWCASANQATLKAAPMKLDEVREKAAEEQGVAPARRQNRNTEQISILAEVCRVPTGGKSKLRTHGSAKVDSKPSKQKSKCSPKCRSEAMETTDLASALRNALGMPKQGEMNACSIDGRRVAKTEITSSKGIPRSKHPNKPPITNEASTPTTPVEEFDLVAFRRTLATTLTKLASDRCIPAAIQYIRLQQVPLECQTDQFVDLLSRIVEERRGAVRRCAFAFAVGLGANEDSPFDRNACLEGIRRFFQDDYIEMCREVQRLPAIMKSEFVPTMLVVFSASELNAVMPEELRE
jgi:hypothetical protein